MSFDPFDGVPNNAHRDLMTRKWGPAVDVFFGEYIRLIPMCDAKGPNAAQDRDPQRDEIVVPAVFRAPATDATLTDLRQQLRPEDLRSAAPAILTKPHFSIAINNLPYGIRRRDLIVRCATGEQYEAHVPIKDALGIRVLVPVNQLGIDRGSRAPSV